MKICIIMQGVPGSGKSHIASALALVNNATICSTDYYFYEDGVYKFDFAKLGENHKKNLKHAINVMSCGFNLIVDNTNIRQKDVQSYIDAARGFGYHVQFIRVTGDNFGNTHNVPQETIDRMKRQMENLED